MFFEELAYYTRDHILSHINTYITLMHARHPGDAYKLVVPSIIDASPILGATIPVDQNSLPQYAIHIDSKLPAPSSEDMYDYLYDGVITFMVGSNTAKASDILAKRHAALLEQFVRDHLRFHLYADPQGQFKLAGLLWNTTDIGEPIQLERLTDNPSELWIVAGALNLTWQVWEDGAGDVDR